MITAQDLVPTWRPSRRWRPSTGRARCNDGNGTLTYLFFSEDLIDIARAKAICSKCSLAVACLAERPRAPGAVGRLGRPAAGQRQHRRPQAPTGPTTEAPPARSGRGRGAPAPALHRQEPPRRRPFGGPGQRRRDPGRPGDDPWPPVSSRAMAWSRRRSVIVGVGRRPRGRHARRRRHRLQRRGQRRQARRHARPSRAR